MDLNDQRHLGHKLQAQALANRANLLIATAGLVQEYLVLTAAVLAENSLLLKRLHERTNEENSPNATGQPVYAETQQATATNSANPSGAFGFSPQT